MDRIVVIFLALLMVSCSKKTQEKEIPVQETPSLPPYDTIARDSFSMGAIPANIARQIKISSPAYQDSLKVVRKKMEEEKLLLKEKEDKDKLAKKVEEEAKKTEAAQVKKEKEKNVQDNPASTKENNL